MGGAINTFVAQSIYNSQCAVSLCTYYLFEGISSEQKHLLKVWFIN